MKKIYKSNLASIDNVIFETVKEEISDEKYIDDLQRNISYSIYALLILSATAFIGVLFWVDTIESIIINYL
jgi:hypothetical protein|tara:strand:- start:10 stop:222 length:213 start_codon:yes stop_codon:yes gene_type:complete